MFFVLYEAIFYIKL